MRANEETVRRIVADASAGLYDSFHLNFTPSIPAPLMEQLAGGELLSPLQLLYVWQPVARGHRAYTDLSAARVRGPGDMHSLQPCQLGNDLLLNAAITFARPHL